MYKIRNYIHIYSIYNKEKNGISERDECLPAVYRIKTKLLSISKISIASSLPNTPTPTLISLTLY